MVTLFKTVEVSETSDLLRIAEQVRDSDQPVLLRRGDEELAVLMPMSTLKPPQYTIIESDMGPLISHSRSTVYDVMELYDAGENEYGIAMTYNLTPTQVRVAMQYIDQHRQVLEPQLREILAQAAERERYYNAQAAEIQKRIDQLPMTPLRAAFYALREKNRRNGESGAHANHSE